MIDKPTAYVEAHGMSVEVYDWGYLARLPSTKDTPLYAALRFHGDPQGVVRLLLTEIIGDSVFSNQKFCKSREIPSRPGTNQWLEYLNLKCTYPDQKLPADAEIGGASVHEPESLEALAFEAVLDASSQ